MASQTDDSVVVNENVEESTERGEANVVALHILSVIKDSQQQHGLRHNDYQRYRQYCARRLKRIRHSVHFPAGNRKQVSKKKVTVDKLKDVRFLYIPLVECERAWAYAMQLKQEANTEPRKSYHMTQRMKKAVSHAEHLNTLCESNKVDACTKLEAEAYSAWMKATLAFESENWKGAMELFTKSQTIYEKLSGAFVDDQKQTYSERVSEISPSIRYCAYSSGDESAVQDLRQMRGKTGLGDNMMQKLDELIEKTREKQAATLSEVEWRGRVMPVKNEHVRVFLLSIQDLQQQLEGTDTVEAKLSIYETLTKELIEAQQSLRDELRDDPEAKAVLKGQIPDHGRVPNSIYLHTYLMYLKQTKAVERNTLMIQSLHEAAQAKHSDKNYKPVKPQDLARLYDIIVNNLSEIVDLPGIDDDELIDEIEAQAMGYRAFRCFYIAKSCAAAKRWKESIALYERVNEYTKEALNLLNNVTRVHCNDKEDQIESLKHLIKEVDGVKFSVHASSILDVENVTDSIVTLSLKNTKPLVERLDQYVADTALTSKNPRLSRFPPEFEPVPCKPLFFDLALNHVQFPSLTEKLDGTKKGSGLTGMVKGWLWGK